MDSLKSDTLRNRLTTFSIQPERPDSILSEIWQNGQWGPVQKSIFIYIGQKLGRNIEFNWNNTSGLWENVSFTSYLYDGQKRMTQRLEQKWIDDWLSKYLKKVL